MKVNKANKDLNKYKNWKGYKNAPDILPSVGDAISSSGMISELAFYVNGVSWVHGKQPMKISPHHDFEGVDCSKFSVIGFSKRIHWGCDTYKIPNPNRIVIIYDKKDDEGYEIPSKFVDWSKVQVWEPTLKILKGEE